MKMNTSTANEFETGTAARTGARYLLQLYITGTTANSMRAISNIRKICEEHLEGRYDLDVLDISQDPALAKGNQIIAAPTLIKKLPLPRRQFIGDMSKTECILAGLELRTAAAKTLLESKS